MYKKLQLKRLITTISICLFILQTTSFCESLFSPSIRVGIIGTKINSTRSDRSYSYHDYSYPLGFSIGAANNIRIIRYLYLSSILYFKYNKAKMYYNSAGGNTPYVDYTSNYIRLSSVFGVKVFKPIDLLVGIDIGRKINVNIDIQGEGENCWHLKPDYIPNFDYAICYGIGKQFNIGKMNYIIELKYSDGLTKYKFCSDEEGCIPNPTKNQELQLELGYRF